MIIEFLKVEYINLSRKRSTFLNAIYVSLFIFMIFTFSMGDQKVSTEIAIATLLSGIVFTSILIAEPTLTRDIESGFLVQILSSGSSLRAYLLSKLLFLVTVILSLSLISTLFCALFYHLTPHTIMRITLSIPLLCISFTTVLLILSLFSIATNSSLNIFILALPFIAPILILSSFTILEYMNSFLIMSGICLIYLSLYLFIAKKVLREILLK